MKVRWSLMKRFSSLSERTAGGLSLSAVMSQSNIYLSPISPICLAPFLKMDGTGVIFNQGIK